MIKATKISAPEAGCSQSAQEWNDDPARSQRAWPSGHSENERAMEGEHERGNRSVRMGA